MARKSASQHPVLEPTVPPDEGIRLLREQIAKAAPLCAAGAVSWDEYNVWRAETKAVLAEALGENHQLMVDAISAGSNVAAGFVGSTAASFAINCRAVQSQAKLLEPCIRYLERKVRGSEEVNAPEGSHDTALVCRRGHLLNDAMKLVPDKNPKFCADCGSETISECPACHQPIQGRWLGDPTIHLSKPPAHCQNCGAAFPWTEARLKAVSDLLALTEASDAEQAALRDSLPALTAETPETPVAIVKWRRFLTGAGKRVADGMRDLFVDVAAEAIKRKLFPD